MLDRSTMEATVTIQMPTTKPLDYVALHVHDVQNATVRAKSLALGTLTRKDTSLFTALSTKGFAYSMPNYVVPRSMKHGVAIPGDRIKIGFSSAIVKKEIGRGAYGVVVLVGEDSNGNDTASPIAVKVQCPMGCLAWEYDILQKIEQRIKASSKPSTVQLPIPSPLSFVALADGALMGTTAAGSGTNLVDLRNAYQRKNKRVPEILALHYTARMLHHLEILHWHAKILVRSTILPE
jgi:hypothetical protein